MSAIGHYLNNFMEQDHRGIKQRYYAMRGFESAARFCEAFDEQRNFFRYREFRKEKVSLRKQRVLFKLRYFEFKNAFVDA